MVKRKDVMIPENNEPQSRSAELREQIAVLDAELTKENKKRKPKPSYYWIRVSGLENV